MKFSRIELGSRKRKGFCEREKGRDCLHSFAKLLLKCSPRLRANHVDEMLVHTMKYMYVYETTVWNAEAEDQGIGRPFPRAIRREANRFVFYRKCKCQCNWSSMRDTNETSKYIPFMRHGCRSVVYLFLVWRIWRTIVNVFFFATDALVYFSNSEIRGCPLYFTIVRVSYVNAENGMNL